MARPLRVGFPGAVYPITSRGKEGGAIFPDGREKFLSKGMGQLNNI
jgi:hypothetical protein